MDKNRVRQLLALWAVVLAGMAAFAAESSCTFRTTHFNTQYTP